MSDPTTHLTPPDPDEIADEAYEVTEETYEFEQRDEQVPAGADRPPTADEEAAAERAAGDVDIDEVAAHEREMLERGAKQQGEGSVP